MCISPDAFVAARVTSRLLARGVDPTRAEAVGKKVARRYGDRRNEMYLAYLAGVETGRGSPEVRAQAGREPRRSSLEKSSEDSSAR